MQTIFSKLKDLLSGKANDAVDAQIRENKASYSNEKIRKVKAAKEKAEEEDSKNEGDIKTTEDLIKEKKEKDEDLEREIKLLIAAKNDEDKKNALKKTIERKKIQAEMEKLQEHLNSLIEKREKYQELLSAANAKIDELSMVVEGMKSDDRMTEVNESSADAFNEMSELLSEFSSSVDGLDTQAKREMNTSEVRLKKAMEKIDTGDSRVRELEAEAELNQMIAEMEKGETK